MAYRTQLESAVISADVIHLEGRPIMGIQITLPLRIRQPDGSVELLDDSIGFHLHRTAEYEAGNWKFGLQEVELDDEGTARVVGTYTPSGHSLGSIKETTLRFSKETPSGLVPLRETELEEPLII